MLFSASRICLCSPVYKLNLLFFLKGGNAKKRFPLYRKQRKSFVLWCMLVLKGRGMSMKKRRARGIVSVIMLSCCMLVASCSTIVVPESDDERALPDSPVIEVDEYYDPAQPVIIDIPYQAIAVDEEEHDESDTPALSSPFPGSGLLGSIDVAESTEEVMTIRISLWESGERRAKLEDAFALYESMNPNVDIIAEFIDYPGYWGNISADIGGGRFSDIIEMDSDHISQYSQKSLIVPLSGYITGFSGYGIMLGYSIPVMVFDRAIINGLGITLPEVFTLDALREIGSVVYDKLGIKTATSLGMDLLEALLRWYGKDVYSEILSGDIDYISQYFSIVKEIKSYPFFTSDESESTWNRFVTSADIKDEDGIVQLGNGTVEAEALFSVTTAADYPEQAVALLAWLASSSDLTALFRLSFGYPAYRSISSLTLDWDENKQLMYFEAAADDVQEFLPPAGNSEIALLLHEYSAKVINGMDADEAASQFSAKARDILIRAGGGTEL